MTRNTVRPGWPVYLEMNAQRVTSAMRFHNELFTWTSAPLHVPPWGNIAVISNGDRNFGAQFMSMGGFSTPRWLPYFRTSSVGGDCERARRAGGIVQMYQEVIPDLGGLVVLADPAGACFGIVNPDEK